MTIWRWVSALLGDDCEASKGQAERHTDRHEAQQKQGHGQALEHEQTSPRVARTVGQADGSQKHGRHLQPPAQWIGRRQLAHPWQRERIGREMAPEARGGEQDGPDGEQGERELAGHDEGKA